MTIWGTLSSKTQRRRLSIQYLAAPLAPSHGTLVCRGTPVGNHWTKLIDFNRLFGQNIQLQINQFEIGAPILLIWFCVSSFCVRPSDISLIVWNILCFALCVLSASFHHFWSCFVFLAEIFCWFFKFYSPKISNESFKSKIQCLTRPKIAI